MLTPLEISSYQESGYVLPDYRVSDETVESIRERYERLLLEHPEFRDNCSALLRYDPAFAQYAFEPAILDLVEQLIGPDIALWNMSFFAKPALNGKAVPWHQDGEYWPIRPLATCTVWIALDDSTTENGCLRVISGSHRNRALLAHRNNPNPDFVLHQQLIETEFDEDKAVDITLQKGRISLHDVYLAHGSAPNTSAHRRRGITMRFMPTTSHYDCQLAAQMHVQRGGNNLALNPLLLMRGSDQHGANAFTKF